MTLSRREAPWWRRGVFYEVYLRSFRDGDGDGVGDFAGLLEGMQHIVDLGVEAIWITPFQRTGGKDQGYDVVDYCSVDPIFGTLEDFDAVLARAHESKLRVLIDLVPNHSSNEHELFHRALAAGPGSPERDMFIFRDGLDGGTRPPNNWTSVFGGPAWTPAHADPTVDSQWYLHLYSRWQPDWNWRNPAVHRLMEDALRFWFDRGVDGVRVDVAHGLYKADGLPDLARAVKHMDGLRSNAFAMNQPEVHDVYRCWRHIANDYEPSRVMVGEVNLPSADAAQYVRSDELSLAMSFETLGLGWDRSAWVEVGNRILTAFGDVGAPVAWVLENHDVVRLPTRLGGGEPGRGRALGLLTLLLAAPGAVVLYQGQELGLEEVVVPAEAQHDPAREFSALRRDGCRVPLPWWNNGAGPASQPPGSVAVPWLPEPRGWGDFAINASPVLPALEFVREALRVRRSLPECPAGEARFSAVGEGILQLEYPGVRAWLNMGSTDVELSEAPLHAWFVAGNRLAPGGCAWWLLDEA